MLAFRTSLPVLFGYLAIGIAFGLMLIDKKYPVWMAPVMSVIMFAGAGQYVAVGLFAAALPLHAILITELLVNIRHIVYGLSLITKFKKCGAWKYYLIFGLTDETYSLLTSTDVPEGEKAGPFYGTIAILDHLYWITGSVIGAVIGAVVTSKTSFSLEGVDFALTALFAVLLIEQILKTKDLLPPVLGAITTLGAIVLWRFNILKDSNNILIIALALGIAVLLMVRRPDSESKAEALKVEEKNE